MSLAKIHHSIKPTRPVARINEVFLEESLHPWIDEDTQISMISHELLTPLTALQLQIERGQRISEKLTGEHRAEMLGLNHRLSKTVQRLTELVRNLTDDATQQEQSIHLRCVKTCLSDSLHHLADELRPLVEASHFELIEEIPHGIWSECDKRRVEQVVTNLASNAMRHGESPIRLTVSQDAKNIYVSVRDHGAGVPEAMVDQIFLRFVRGAAGRGNRLGLGLGLFISRRLAEAHGGWLRVQKPADGGRGACFVLSLPRQAYLSGQAGRFTR